MTNWRTEVKKDSAFLYYHDIEGKTPLAVTIDGYERHPAYCPGKGEEGELWCLKFKGATKQLGINVTNGTLIEHLHGPDVEGWVGKAIVLRVAECRGEKCIRVHAPGCKFPPQVPKFRYLDNPPKEDK